MAESSAREIYFSFFMFTVDLRPNDPTYTKEIIRHIQTLREMGYTGFDLPIPPTDTLNHQSEVDSYLRLMDAFDAAGLADVRFTTNVGATKTFDPSSPYQEQRDAALAYLKSRVDITRALRGEIMAGPIVVPYGVFPTTDFNQPIWSDQLQDWLVLRYKNAQPILEALGEYAVSKFVKVAIEPVDHWETPGPNMVEEVMHILDHVKSTQVGVCIDSAHVVLGSSGPEVYTDVVQRALAAGRLHYVHLSAPDRGAVRGSWVPWDAFLGPILKCYEGPYLVEVFNAIPAFLSSLRLTRRKFWIPDVDKPVPGQPSAYDIAREAIAEVRRVL